MHPSPIPTSRSPSPRAPGLDLLRAIAIGVVMLYHLSSHGIDGVAGDLAANAPFAASVVRNGASLAMAALPYMAVERPGLRMRRGTPRRLPGALAG
jgi:peptidoglycan/LPS O-acetylase OafA/YrhL